MSTLQAYASNPHPARQLREQRPLCRIRRAIIARGWRSLREWALAQRDPIIRYGTVRMTIERWAERDTLPDGAIGRLIATRLHAELGHDLCSIWPAACQDDQ